MDSNLRQNSLIRDCKTLVRRDRNEEPKLVSYIVPEVKGWPQWLKDHGLEDVEDEGTEIGPIKIYHKRFRRMQTELRDHLKDRLPSYAVPSIFLVLNKIPLTPNGKTDKQCKSCAILVSITSTINNNTIQLSRSPTWWNRPRRLRTRT